MMITETTILIACFFLTFGFIFYKIAGFVKNKLDAYRFAIDEKINESEKLRISSICAFDEARKQFNKLNNDIDELNSNLKNKMDEIKKTFEEKLSLTLEKKVLDSKNKIVYEKQQMLDELKSNISKTMKQAIEDVLQEANYNSNEARKETLLKIDFKKILGEG